MYIATTNYGCVKWIGEKQCDKKPAIRFVADCNGDEECLCKEHCKEHWKEKFQEIRDAFKLIKEKEN